MTKPTRDAWIRLLVFLYPKIVLSWSHVGLRSDGRSIYNLRISDFQAGGRHISCRWRQPPVANLKSYARVSDGPRSRPSLTRKGSGGDAVRGFTPPASVVPPSGLKHKLIDQTSQGPTPRRCTVWIIVLTMMMSILTLHHSSLAGGPEPLPTYAASMSLREDASLHSVAFADARTGIAVGDRGTILQTEDGGESWQLRDSGVQCRLDDVIWIDRKRVIASGGGYDRITQISRGVILRSEDAGRTWKRAGDEELPRVRQLIKHEDGSLVAQTDWSHPALSNQFESHNLGLTWESNGRSTPITQVARSQVPSLYRWVSTTRMSVAIRDAVRIGDQAICAVGDHGVVLVSFDNGQSWQTPRGQRRTAVLVIASKAFSVPWAMIGAEAFESKHRVSLLLAEEAESLELASQAAVMLGGSGVDRVDTQKADQDLATTAAAWIAIHRPVAIAMDDSLSHEFQEAFVQAATEAGVQRIAISSLGDGHGTTLHRDALLTKSGVLASDLAHDAQHLVAPSHDDVASIALRYLYDVAPSRRGDSILSGLSLSQAHTMGAKTPAASRRQLQILQARMKQTKQIEQLIELSHRVDRFSTLMKDMLDQSAKDDQFRLAWSILQHLEPGSPATVATLTEIADRFPDMSAGRWARLRRNTIANSVEWNRLRATTTPNILNQDATASGSGSVAVSPFQVETGSVRQVSAIAPLIVPKPDVVEFNPSRSSSRRQTTEVDILWEFHPAVLIAAEAVRQSGDHDQLQPADGESANLKRLIESGTSPWSPLLAPESPQVIHAVAVSAPPRLDGIFDDPCWKSSKGTALQMAYDDQYVYVAFKTPSERMSDDSEASNSTIRDHPLKNVDRMQLNIDVDRDIMSAMQLQVTTAGRTHDAVDEDPAWQPTWYVASKRANGTLTFELAILRRDLVELPIHPSESWFVSAQPIRCGHPRQLSVLPNPSSWLRVEFR